MVHDGEQLALGLKALDDSRIVHAGFDQLERDLAADGGCLLGEPYLSHAPFAELSQKSKPMLEHEAGFQTGR